MDIVPVRAELKDGFLHLSIPISNGKVSKSGKSLLVATTGGFQPVLGTPYSINYNLIKPFENQ